MKTVLLTREDFGKVKIKVSQLCLSPRQTSPCSDSPETVYVFVQAAFPALQVPDGVRLYNLVPGLLSLNTAGGVYIDLSLNCQQHLVFVE